MNEADRSSDHISQPFYTHSTLIDILRGRAHHQPHRRAYVFLLDGEIQEACLTYIELDRQARAIAALLQELGDFGERVLLLYQPGLAYIAGFFGCLYAGMIAVPAFPPRTDRRLSRLQAIITDSRPTVVLTTESTHYKMKSWPVSQTGLEALRWLTTDNIETNAEENWRPPRLTDNTVALLQYTSGSTSTPKGVMVSHGNLTHNEKLIQKAFEQTEESVIAGWLPLYHDMGLIGNVLQPLYVGATSILMSPVAFLQRPCRWLEAITRYKVTTSGGPNFAYDLCVRRISSEEKAALDLSTWTVAFNGSEPIRADTIDRFTEAFEPYGFRRESFYPCYGLAEATLFVSGGLKADLPIIHAVGAPAHDQNRSVAISVEYKASRRIVSCGHSRFDQKVVIVDPELCTPCSSGQVGEIWVSGPSVANGYWGRVDETERAFGARIADTGEGPFLRTGDLGYFHHGDLFVTGRIKDLIIIRGQNHYPQDIERTVEQAHYGLRADCCVAFSVEVEGEERLVVVQEVERSYRHLVVEDVSAAIRRAVAETHELQVYAVVLVKPGAVPKTSSGKTRRQACRSAFLEKSLAVIEISILDGCYSKKGNEGLTHESIFMTEPEGRQALLESFLREQLGRILRMAPSDFDSRRPIISLGIDSLMAVELQGAIETNLGIIVPAINFLEGISIAQLADQLLDRVAPTPSMPGKMIQRTKQDLKLSPLECSSRGGDKLLSFDQERLWLLDQLAPGTSAYNIPIAARMEGRLNVIALEQSLNEILRRHEVLRATFAIRNGSPAQIISPALSLRIPVIDFGDWQEAERDAMVNQLVTGETQRPFDLAKGPLFRAVLLRLGKEAYLATFTMHHIVSDVWSMTIFNEEVAALYATFCSGNHSSLSELTVQYADFADWQRSGMNDEVLRTQLSYWRNTLRNVPQLLRSPTNQTPALARNFPSASKSFDLSPALCESLRQLSRKEECTLFMTLLASFKIVLHSYTGQRDIVIGSPAFGRLHPETRGMIGFFAHPLALRTDLSGNPTFQELVVRVRETALGAYANQEAPFAKVVSAVQPDRSIRHSSLFQAMFSFLDKPVGVTDMPGLTLSYLDTEKGSTDFELFLTMFKRGEGLHGVLEYNTDLFRSNLIELLVDSFCDVLKKCVQDPKSDLAQFEPPGAPALRPEPAQPCELTPEIAIAATFTAEPIEEPLAFWMDELAIPSKIVFAPYSQVFQQLLDPSGLLSKQRDGINVVLVRLEDWRTHMGNTNMSEGGQASVARGIEHDAQNLVLAVRAMLARTMRPLVVCMCPASPAADDKIGRDAIFGRVEKLIASQLEGASGFHFISTAELAAAYPVETYYDTHGDKLAHIPYTAEFYTSLATNIARKIHAIKRASYKVIVLDCDQTLWKGVCGEDGAYGIEIDTSRRALQEFMVKQHDAGMLICLCSKNNECDVLEVFEQRGEMPLGRDHIVSWRINWRAKSENIQSLAEELQLGLENFIFIDDDPVECAEVRANCPEVLTLQLPQDPNNISRFLDHVWVFDHLGITEEGKKRTSLYRENVKRELLRKGALTLKDFLGGLDLKVEIAPLEHRHFTRASELTNRTNQFNFSGVRRSESEIQKLHQSHSFELLVVNVCDRFGDYGLVGLMIYEAGTKSIKVDTFLLSCRALGRGVEHQMLAKLGNLALMRELSDVEIAFNPNKRNQPAQEFLNGFGLQHLQLNDGSWLFKYPASLVSKSYEKYLEEPIQEGSLHPSCRIPVSDIETPNFGAWESNIGYIANELYDVEHILDALHSRKRARLRSASSIFGAEDRNVKHSESFVVPRNPIEKSLADIWIELLNVKEIGVHDNFFELGGYSLLAIQSMSRAREIFGVELSIRSFFQRPTIADVAVEVEEALISQVEAEEMDDVLKELEKLSDEAVKELLVNEMS